MTDPVGVLYLRLLPKLLHQRDFLLNATNKPEHPQKGRAEGAKLDSQMIRFFVVATF